MHSGMWHGSDRVRGCRNAFGYGSYKFRRYRRRGLLVLEALAAKYRPSLRRLERHRGFNTALRTLGTGLRA